MIDDLVCRNEQCSGCAARERNKIEVVADEQRAEGGRGVQSACDVAGDENFGEFVIAEFEHAGRGDRFADQRGIEERPAQIHVEHPHEAAGRGDGEGAADRRAGNGTALPERAEVERIDVNETGGELGSPRDLVPRGVGVNFETGFAGRIDAHADGAGGSCGDRLDERCIQTEATKNLGGLVAAWIIPNGTEQGHAAAVQLGVTSEVSRRTAEARSRGEMVPQHFAAGENGGVVHEWAIECERMS